MARLNSSGLYLPHQDSPQRFIICSATNSRSFGLTEDDLSKPVKASYLFQTWCTICLHACDGDKNSVPHTPSTGHHRTCWSRSVVFARHMVGFIDMSERY